MCLVIGKPRGVKLPKGKHLVRWFNQFPDGFGIAFQFRGQVRLLKGALDIDEMFALVNKMRRILTEEKSSIKDIDVLIQFRQAVTGRACREYCHPFPMSSQQGDLDSLDVLADCVLAHNGTIQEYYEANWKAKGKDKNDAQEFIKDYLVGMGDALWNPAVQELIRVHTRSKFALLTAQGLSYIGTFIADGGLLFSNPSYQGQVEGGFHRANLCDCCEQTWGPLYDVRDDMGDDCGAVCEDCFILLTHNLPTYKDRHLTSNRTYTDEYDEYFDSRWFEP